MFLVLPSWLLSHGCLNVGLQLLPESRQLAPVLWPAAGLAGDGVGATAQQSLSQSGAGSPET